MSKRKRALPPRRCRKCGEVKPPEAFETCHKRNCRECNAFTPCSICDALSRPDRSTCGDPVCVHEANVRSGSKAGHASYRIWLSKHGRRKSLVCPSCGKRKALTDEHWRVSLRNPDGTVRRWSPYCKPCCRAYYRMVYAMNPAWRARAHANSERNRSELQKRLEADPGLAEQHREHHRELSRRYRLRKSEAAPVVQSRGGTHLLAAPFLAWCERAMQRYLNETAFCEATGVSGRYLSAMRAGEKQHVHLDVVDEALQRDGNDFLWDLYPDIYEDADLLEVA